jgi:hypothetical protein
VKTVNREEGPAYGAALLAAAGTGAFATLGDAAQATLTRTAPERPDRDLCRARSGNARVAVRLWLRYERPAKERRCTYRPAGSPWVVGRLKARR